MIVIKKRSEMVIGEKYLNAWMDRDRAEPAVKKTLSDGGHVFVEDCDDRWQFFVVRQPDLEVVHHHEMRAGDAWVRTWRVGTSLNDARASHERNTVRDYTTAKKIWEAGRTPTGPVLRVASSTPKMQVGTYAEGLAKREHDAQKLKHGPGGLGGPGPCDRNCIKCAQVRSESRLSDQIEAIRDRKIVEAYEKLAQSDSVLRHVIVDGVDYDREVISAAWSRELRRRVAARDLAERHVVRTSKGKLTIMTQIDDPEDA